MNNFLRQPRGPHLLPFLSCGTRGVLRRCHIWSTLLVEHLARMLVPDMGFHRSLLLPVRAMEASASGSWRICGEVKRPDTGSSHRVVFEFDISYLLWSQSLRLAGGLWPVFRVAHSSGLRGRRRVFHDRGEGGGLYSIIPTAPLSPRVLYTSTSWLLRGTSSYEVNLTRGQPHTRS